MTGRHASLHLQLALIYTALALLVLLFARTARADIGEPLGQHLYYPVAKGEDFYDVAQKFDIGIGELRAANPRVIESKLREGQTLVLPTSHLMPDVAHEGIVINLPERRLYYFGDPSGPMSFPVTVGKEGWETPMGETYIANKRVDPVWTVPDKIRAESPDLPAVVPPGPDNPLGKYAMDLGFNGIRIHGTNNPKSIGKQSSHGCIRMYPADIEKLFNLVPLKTKVTIINQPYKIGWLGNNLLLEVSPPAAGTVARAVTQSDVRTALNQKLTTQALVDWETVDVTIKRRDGMPVSIGRKAQGQPALAQTQVPAQIPPQAQAAPSYYIPDAKIAVMRADVPATRTATRTTLPAFTPYTVRQARPVAPPAYYVIRSGGGTTDSGEYSGYYANTGDE